MTQAQDRGEEAEVERVDEQGEEGRGEGEARPAGAARDEHEEQPPEARERGVQPDAGHGRRTLRGRPRILRHAEREAPQHPERVERAVAPHPEAGEGARRGGGGDQPDLEPGAGTGCEHGRKQTAPRGPLKGPAPPRAPRVERAGAPPYVATMQGSGDPAATAVLVVEDRDDVRALIERALASRGYRVHTAADGESGLHAALDLAPALVILDVGLPKQSGFDVARELRRRGFLAPVLMLTAYNSVTDKVAGLDAGADDYLAKPFDYAELLARVNALLRRAALRAGDAVVHVGALAVDTIAREVTHAGRPVPLTQREYALLEYLARNAGRPVTREQISDHVWKAELDPKTNIVDVYVNYLRKKLDAAGAPPLLHTVRGTGYVLKDG